MRQNSVATSEPLEVSKFRKLPIVLEELKEQTLKLTSRKTKGYQNIAGWTRKR